MRGRGFLAVLALLLSVSPALANYWEGHAAFRRGDYQTAHREFLRLAELGHAAAQFNLGYLYQHGLSVPRDPAGAVRWYLESARQGRVEAQFSLGALYETGTGVARDLVLAYRWYNLAASNVPSGESRDRLIRHRQRISGKLSAAQLSAVEAAPAPAGFALRADLAAAEATLRLAPAVIDIQRELAARKFDPGAIDGRMGGSTVGALSAFQASKGLAVTGEADAATLDQLFGPEEVAPHLEPFPRMAAVREDPAPPAVPVPPVEAIELEPPEPPVLVAEAPATAAPEAPAPEPKVVPEPEPEDRAEDRAEDGAEDGAGDLDALRRVAERGDAAAQIVLATKYHYGQGVAEDHSEAAKWYAMAAEQGRVDAMFPLGSLYENGSADLRDLAEAYKWYKRAAELVASGKAHEIIAERRDRVAKLLSGAQSAAAEDATAPNTDPIDAAGEEPPAAPTPNRAPSDLTFTAQDGATPGEIRIAENTSGGIILGAFRATDPDEGEVLTYRLSETAGGRFAVDSDDGTLLLRDAAELDFEDQDSHEIRVRVTDAAGLAYEEAMVVRVVDVNEAPTAEAADFVVSESASEGSVLGRIAASDPDAGDNGKIGYALADGGPFAVDPVSGLVTVADGAALDFETRPRYELTVAASDGGGLSRQIPLTVRLTDSNEAPHGIEIAVGGAVAEHMRPGTVVGRVVASDPDAGERLVYSLADDAGGRFAIDPSTGTIVVAEGAKLDFEEAVRRFAIDPETGLIIASNGEHVSLEQAIGHRVLVRVADAAGLTHEAALAIKVIDLNERPWAEAAAFTLDENAPDGTAVGRVEAGDPDRGKYGRLRYAVTDDGSPFAIDAATGEVTVADGSQLDYEARSGFKFTVAVSDGGGLSTTSVVSVDLRDTNEPPEGLAMTGGTVAENAQGGAAVAKLLARDPDAGDRLTYSLVDDAGGRFSIDAATGAVTLREGARLNFDEAASHDIGVRVSDAGGLSYTKKITLAVTDENLAPTVAALSDGSVPENAEAGTLVAKVLASDPDAGERLTYRLTEDADGRFVIDADSGHITVSAGARLDYETAASHQLKVRISDTGGLVHDEALAVAVVDVNEAPRVTGGSLVLDEIAGPGTTVGRLRADDPDSGAYGALRYAITGDNSNGRFVVDPATGVIAVAEGAVLDFEDRRSYKLVVTATDGGGLMDSAVLAVDLADHNEPPAGLRLMVGKVPENAADGRQAGQVLALDPDAGDHLTYSLTEDAGGRFAIDPNNGTILVADGSRFDFEAADSHRIAVRVTDSGGLTYDETVVIALSDSNEAPVAKAESLAVWEYAAVGTAVGRLGASDPDAGDRLTFALVDDAGGRFAIDPTSGAITVADGSDLNYETDPSIRIVATVTDRDGLSDTVAVAIDLADRNEAPGGSVTIEGTVAENAAEGTLAAVYAGRDPDAGDRVTYRLTDDAGGRFAIDAGRGLIRVAKDAKLDFEAAPLHRVGVRVTDSGGLTYDDEVTIALLDVDETAAKLDLVALDVDETNGDATNGEVTNGRAENGTASHGPAADDKLLEAVVAAEGKLAAGNGHAILGQGNRVAAVQAQLIEAGFDPGPVDGKMGPRTRAALSKYQQAFRLTDMQHEDLLDHMLMLAHFRRGYDYQTQGEYDKSISEYSEVIRLSPQHFSAYYNRGLAHYAQRRYGEATEDFAKVIEARPDYAGAFVNRGNAYYRQGLYVKAARDYARAFGIWITPW